MTVRKTAMTAMTRGMAALLLIGLLVLAGCSPLEAPLRSLAAGGDDAAVGSESTDDAGSSPARWRPTVDGWTIHLEGPDGSVPVARVDPAEGRPVHVTVRPGDHPSETLLVVLRSAVVPGPRYVLRYLDVDPTTLAARADRGDDSPADLEVAAPELWWLPWRLQIDAEHGAGADAAPRPVWSPDGSSVAWVEWDADSTTLRLLRWGEDGPTTTSSTPLDDATTRGLQLAGWERTAAGQDVLSGMRDGEMVRLELADAAGSTQAT
ncbi:MAG: hypothetical protein ACLFRD_04375 [Nitriliruptoraceae bacterium]